MSTRTRVAIALATLVALPMALVAQTEETLTGGRLVSGGFGGPVFKITQLHGDFAAMSGGRGGWIVNHQFILGGAGYGLAPQGIRTAYTTAGGSRPELEMGYGGVDIGYVNRSHRLVHVEGDVLVGGGHVGYQGESNSALSDVFSVVEPTAGVELNVTPWFRLGAGASYRWVGGASIPDVTNKDLSGAAGTLTFKFGKF